MERKDRLKRRPGGVAIALGLGVAVLTTLFPCGPAPSRAVYVLQSRPDFPVQDFFKGRLGVLLPSYRRVYLMVAYRHLSGSPLTDSEVEALTSGPAMAAWNPPDRPEVTATDVWRRTRANVGDGRSPRYIRQTIGREGRYFLNCNDDAFLSAASTLLERIERYGAESPEVSQWAAAQDQVFENCDGGPTIPTPLPAGADPLQVADRQYQIAAANFYAGRFDAAERQFEAIAANPDSPWSSLSAYLVARVYIRRATLKKLQGDDPDLLRLAEKKILEILESPRLREWHWPARSLLSLVRARLQPLETVATLGLRLSRPSSSVAEFSRDLRDYSWLTRERPVRTQVATRTDGMTRWIQRFLEDSAEEALREWSRDPSELNLLVAATRLGGDDPNAGAILEALKDADTEGPGAPTLQFHRARLLAEAGRESEARRLLDQSLESLDLPPSARNTFLGLRFKLAANWNEFTRLALMKAVAVEHLWVSEIGPGESELRQPGLHALAARVVSRGLPLSRFRDMAWTEDWPPLVRREVIVAGWTRAVLLEDWERARELSIDLAEWVPETRPYLNVFLGETTPSRRKFAAVYLLVHFPGFKLNVDSAPARELPMHRLDIGALDWWCSPSRGTLGGSAYRPGALQEGLWKATPGRKVLLTRFLGDDERHAAESELRALDAQETAPNYLARAVLEYARSHRSDSRVPEALHLAVRATRWGCTDESTPALSKQAYVLLHNHYPGSVWARRTKYWY